MYGCFEIELAQYENTDFLYVLRFNKRGDGNGANAEDDEDEVEDGVVATTKEGAADEGKEPRQEKEERVFR